MMRPVSLAPIAITALLVAAAPIVPDAAGGPELLR